ncbi:MAG: class II glutamine amidotransferase [Catenulispora sp.]
MCRHLAYLGPPKSLRELLIEPPHSLYRQSWEPKRQRSGVVNADGFGVGWFAEGDPEPVRYRQDGPIWADPSFPDIARAVRSRTVLAAVRDATAGAAAGIEAAAPYAGAGWLFSHNGAIDGYPRSMAKLAETIPALDLLQVEARTDSAFIWALIQTRVREMGLEAGLETVPGAGPETGPETAAAVVAPADAMASAVASVVADITAVTGARLNLLLTDGAMIVASVYGDSFSALTGDGRTVVASEPYDDSPGWTDVLEGVHTWSVAGLEGTVQAR